MATRQDPKDAARTPSRSELEAEQQREANQAWAGPGLGAATDAQAKGLIGGSLLWGLIGAVVLLPFGFIPMGDLPLVGRLLICAVVGALAGGTFGALYHGGRQSELEDETRDADGRPSVGSTPRDPKTDHLGR